MNNSSALQNTSIDNTTIEYLDRISNILTARDAVYDENLIKRTSIATLSLHLVEKEADTLTLKV